MESVNLWIALLFISTTVVCSSTQEWPEFLDYEPISDAEPIISGDVRFTVLTSRLIRMEEKKGSTLDPNPNHDHDPNLLQAVRLKIVPQQRLSTGSWPFQSTM